MTPFHKLGWRTSNCWWACYCRSSLVWQEMLPKGCYSQAASGCKGF